MIERKVREHSCWGIVWSHKLESEMLITADFMPPTDKHVCTHTQTPILQLVFHRKNRTWAFRNGRSHSHIRHSFLPISTFSGSIADEDEWLTIAFLMTAYSPADILLNYSNWHILRDILMIN